MHDAVPHNDEPATAPGPWHTGTASLREFEDALADDQVGTIWLAVPDMQGRPKGKILNARVFTERLKSKAEMCAYVLATDVSMTPLDGFDLTGWGQGYGDLGVKADTSSIRFLPHRPGTALVLGDAFHHDGTPVEQAPRQMLRTQLERLADLGYHVSLGTEVEFVLYQGTAADAHTAGYRDLRPAWPHNLDYALQHPPHAADFFHHLHDSLAEAGIPVEAIKTEGAAGQIEVTFAHGDPMRACDAYLAFRMVVQDLAQRHGMTAVFMAAPQDGVGSGLHLHLSLWSAHGNAFTYRRGQDLPPVMEQSIAGLLSGLPHLAPLYLPSPNSCKRYAPHSFAPTRYLWGFDNRGCAVRVTGSGEGAHLEVRLPGADANLYLALTAACAAIVHGLQDNPGLPPPCTGDSYTVADAACVPADLADAVHAFDSHKIAIDALGEHVVRHYTQAALAEIAVHQRLVTDIDRQRYFDSA